eukprot:scaffold20155_cov64-Phaeocystis_antarctica.AAC.1
MLFSYLHLLPLEITRGVNSGHTSFHSSAEITRPDPDPEPAERPGSWIMLAWRITVTTTLLPVPTSLRILPCLRESFPFTCVTTSSTSSPANCAGEPGLTSVTTLCSPRTIPKSGHAAASSRLSTIVCVERPARSSSIFCCSDPGADAARPRSDAAP